MSIASPTRRSSSSTVPGPSFSNSPTSIFERPSTAETCTGTSNTASRSAAIRETCSSSLYSTSSIDGVLAALRSGSGTSASVSLMVQSSSPWFRLVAGRYVAPDKFVDLCFDRRALQHDAAIGPLDPAIAGLDFRLGQDHETALEAALFRQLLDPLACGLVEGIVDPDHEMRRRDQMRETIAHQSGDLAKRLAGNQLAAQLARYRNRDIDGFGLHPGFNAGEACRDALNGDPDLLKRQRDAAVAFRLRLALPGIETVAIGVGLGRGDLLRNFRGRGRPLAGLVRRGEVHVEQKFCGSGHQYTSSSSARLLVSMISPLAARSFARLTSSACASSTSRNRTGPSAAMSSSSILPARDDILPRKKPRTSSLALFSAPPSLSLSTWRISVCADAESSLTRSSKVNISALMRSAASRFSSSSEVMKRGSV